MSIRRLPEHLVNRIAAGEVVERPASALKELVENAIDAGATRIAVALAGGGIGRIEVVDDGCGMTPDRHGAGAGAPCHLEAAGRCDRERSTTLGFRGEALPSIASVARLTLESRRCAAAADGWSRIVDNGGRGGRGAGGAAARHAHPRRGPVRARAGAAQVPALATRSEYAACLDVGEAARHGAARYRLHARA